jgi:hypothetical protein
MRLSSLVVASILLASTTVLAQHSSGGGGGSHGGGSSSSASSAGSYSSSASHSYGGTSTASHSSSFSKSTSSPSKSTSSSSKESAAPEKQSSRSFFHPFRKTKPVESAELKVRSLCLKGPCAVCPRGQLRGSSGACAIASNACPARQPWNGFACGTQGLFDDCNRLARELAEQREQMQSQSDYGQSLRYGFLQQQYQQCLMRSRTRFGAYAATNAFLLDTP